MSRLGANWNYKYVLLTPVIGLAIFLVYIWFVRVAGSLAAQYDFRGDGPGVDGAGTMKLRFQS